MLLQSASSGRLSLPGGLTLSDLVGLATVVLALVALKYARDSARAAEGTVVPLQIMASQLRTLLGEASAAVKLVQRAQRESRVNHQLDQYERVMLAVTRISEGYRRFRNYIPTDYLEQARGELATALSQSSRPPSYPTAGRCWPPRYPRLRPPCQRPEPSLRRPSAWYARA